MYYKVIGISNKDINNDHLLGSNSHIEAQKRLNCFTVMYCGFQTIPPNAGHGKRNPMRTLI